MVPTVCGTKDRPLGRFPAQATQRAEACLPCAQTALSESTLHTSPEDLLCARLCPRQALLEGQDGADVAATPVMSLRPAGYPPSRSKASKPPLSLSSSTVLQDIRGDRRALLTVCAGGQGRARLPERSGCPRGCGSERAGWVGEEGQQVGGGLWAMGGLYEAGCFAGWAGRPQSLQRPH